MILVIGGASQGKRAWAEEHYPGRTWIDGAVCSREELFACEAVDHFHLYLRRQLEAGCDLTDLAEELCRRNPELLLVSTEIGYGIVPADAFERDYREAVGRVCTKLAAGSRQVVRVVCGLGTVIRG